MSFLILEGSELQPLKGRGFRPRPKTPPKLDG
jgi:hypothetical protein